MAKKSGAARQNVGGLFYLKGGDIK